MVDVWPLHMQPGQARMVDGVAFHGLTCVYFLPCFHLKKQNLVELMQIR